MESTITEHRHNGIDSHKINIKDLEILKQSITGINTSGFSSGGDTNLKSSDASILENMRTRINEIEAVLRSLNLLN